MFKQSSQCGIGINTSIFTLLYSQGNRHDSGTGLGLGLYIVREIAKAHGGDVTVRSGDGETVFAVRLPRRH